MEYRFERTDTAVIVTPEGRIDSAGSIRLDAAVWEHLVPEDTAVLFDMAGVSYISSAGIRVFSTVEKMLRQRNGHVYLCSLQPAVAKVLDLTGFSRVLSISATKEEALSRCRLAQSPGTAGPGADPAASHTRLSSESFPDHPAVLKITGSPAAACRGTFDPGDFVPRIFIPDEFSV
ncbi:MAG: STAS domain-containing protein, partial [Methanomicrobiales archaeon]|nr:STAS domain-containing protein [Methanomicrobiales archaeon]